MRSNAASKRSLFCRGSMPKAEKRAGRNPRPNPMITRPWDNSSSEAISSAIRIGSWTGRRSEVVARRIFSVRAARAARISRGEVVTPGAKCISGSQTEWSPRSSALPTHWLDVFQSRADAAPPKEIPMAHFSTPQPLNEGGSQSGVSVFWLFTGGPRGFISRTCAGYAQGSIGKNQGQHVQLDGEGSPQSRKKCDDSSE